MPVDSPVYRAPYNKALHSRLQKVTIQLFGTGLKKPLIAFTWIDLERSPRGVFTEGFITFKVTVQVSGATHSFM